MSEELKVNVRVSVDTSSVKAQVPPASHHFDLFGASMQQAATQGTQAQAQIAAATKQTTSAITTQMPQATRGVQGLGTSLQQAAAQAAPAAAQITSVTQQATSAIATATARAAAAVSKQTSQASAGFNSLSTAMQAAATKAAAVRVQFSTPIVPIQPPVPIAPKPAPAPPAPAPAPTPRPAPSTPGGISPRQTAAALRGVPAQFTDIVVGLQGGQAPLTVLLQQGGQLKDMFGGAGAAARALGGYVLGLVNPFTVAAAAVVALGAAYFQGTSYAQEHSKALIVSGNAAGQTVSGMRSVAEGVSKTVGSYGQAASALDQLVASGRVTGDVLALAATSVVASNKAIGTSVEDAVSVFVKLADEPTKASAKLNESQHYLTQATYERIKALEEQGRKEEAAGLAQKTYAAESLSRMQQVREEAGWLARSLSFVGTTAGNMWAALANNVASIGTAPDLQRLQEELAKARSGPLSGSPFERKRISGLEDQIRAESTRMMRSVDVGNAAAQKASDEGAAIAATDAVNKWQDKAKGVDAVTRELKKYRAELEAIRKVNPKSEALTPDAIKSGEDAIRKSFAGPKGPKDPKEKAYTDDAATKYLEQLRQTHAALEAQLGQEDKITDAQREQARFQQQLADLKGKKILTADQQSLLAHADTINVQLRENVLAAQIVEIEKKRTKEKEAQAKLDESFVRSAESIRASMASANESRRDQYDRTLSTAGLGDNARQEVEAQKSIWKEFNRSMLSLNEKAAADKQPLDSPAYQQEVERIRKYLDEALADHTAYYAKLQRNRADSSLGISSALSNYVDESSNTFQQAGSAVTKSFKGAEDSLTNFVTKGKLDVRSLADSIISDLARIAIQQTITGPLAKGLLGALGGGTTSIAGASLSTSFVNSVGMSATGMVPMAKGGVFASPSLSAYSNGVYNTPQPFAFAKGAGIFGEAGPEAIMPLRRGADGRLGVSVQGAGAAAPSIVFAPVTTYSVDGRVDRAAAIAEMSRLVAENNQVQMDQLKRIKVVPQ